MPISTSIERATSLSENLVHIRQNIVTTVQSLIENKNK